uniref:Uncharacterized protein n=1 Tax=Oryza nivara TaxID=4536 RepID=A0A0E0HIU2_ORYNI
MSKAFPHGRLLIAQGLSATPAPDRLGVFAVRARVAGMHYPIRIDSIDRPAGRNRTPVPIRNIGDRCMHLLSLSSI